MLLQFPVRRFRAARQHRESLLREFAIIATGGGAEADVPKRLVEIARLHEDRYGGIAPEADRAVEDAYQRGLEYIDVEVDVPPAIAGDTVDLAGVLLEVDDYIRTGQLLTVAPSIEVKLFWIWFLGEFVRQVNGFPPTPWPVFEAKLD